MVINIFFSNAILARPDWAPAAETVLGLIACAIIALLLPILPPLASLALVTAAVLLCGLASYVSFDRAKLLLDATFPSLALVSIYFAGTLALWRADHIARQ